MWGISLTPVTGIRGVRVFLYQDLGQYDPQQGRQLVAENLQVNGPEWLLLPLIKKYGTQYEVWDPGKKHVVFCLDARK